MSKQEMIEKYEEWEENAVLMFDAEFTQAHRDYASNAFKVAHEQQQAKIDELQKRVDDLQRISKEQVEVINAWDGRATKLAWDQMGTAKLNYELQKRIEFLEMNLKFVADHFVMNDLDKQMPRVFECIQEALRGKS